jgi:hypothetical protein
MIRLWIGRCGCGTTPVCAMSMSQATGHIPMENDVEAVARALADFFTGY